MPPVPARPAGPPAAAVSQAYLECSNAWAQYAAIGTNIANLTKGRYSEQHEIDFVLFHAFHILLYIVLDSDRVDATDHNYNFEVFNCFLVF